MGAYSLLSLYKKYVIYIGKIKGWGLFSGKRFL